ncbi:hypothetical protein DM02DRAFT_702639 [Periconia macrospinosa]|uniref:Uncharacterized protein n=1 Tax=Periconia macrospinosa TaxID=97972 RepID=A0A2V1DVC2_9PLEO|nr:hypothetical protein DM02DRAFT_702639 [Periconia macrospinosa]
MLLSAFSSLLNITTTSVFNTTLSINAFPSNSANVSLVIDAASSTRMIGSSHPAGDLSAALDSPLPLSPVSVIETQSTSTLPLMSKKSPRETSKTKPVPVSTVTRDLTEYLPEREIAPPNPGPTTFSNDYWHAFIPEFSCPADHNKAFWVGNSTFVYVECNMYMWTSKWACKTAILATFRTLDFHACLGECILNKACQWAQWEAGGGHQDGLGGDCSLFDSICQMYGYRKSWGAVVAVRDVPSNLENGGRPG